MFIDEQVVDISITSSKRRKPKLFLGRSGRSCRSGSTDESIIIKHKNMTKEEIEELRDEEILYDSKQE